jgi:hypothetical protein
VTQTLRFASEEALRVAVTSALLPAELVAGPAWGWRAGDGAVWIKPLEVVSEGSLATLEGLGLCATEDELPEDARRARCWAELIPLVRDAGSESPPGQVMLVVHGGRVMLETAAELVRLGCDRVELRAIGDLFVLRVVAPPYYTFARALDGSAELEAYVPAPAGHDRVYVQAGYAHPLAALLRPEAGQVLLLSANAPWLSLSDGAWTDLYEIVDLTIPAGTRVLSSSADLPRLTVPMRLVPAHTARTRSEAPTLWVLREDSVVRTERLLASIPEEVALGLLFAVTTSEPPIVVLRARPSAPHGTELGLEGRAGETFRAHPQVPNLFLPMGSSLEPPLRPERLRALFVPEAADIAWLVGPELHVERLPDEAFRPLVDWVEYVVDRGADALRAWVRGATFDLGAFEVEEAAPAPPEKREVRPKKEQRTRPRAERAVEAAPDKPTRRAKAARAPAAEAPDLPQAPPAEVSVTPAADELAARERELLELDAAPDAPERTALWAAMAELHFRAGHARDGALCWSRALWDAAPEEAPGMAAAWARATSMRDASALLTDLREVVSCAVHTRLAKASPTRDEVGAMAALLVATGFAGDAAPLERARVTVWLDRYDEVLDVRSLWLARSSLARLAGGDRLGLARARDRVLQRLHRGLSMERDVPTFLRVLGGAREPDRVERLGSCLVALARRFERTKRAASAVEADPKLTLAYVLFVIGWGCARVGQVDQARALVARASTLLDLGDPVHAFLTRAYSARVEQALEGLGLEATLPADLAGSLNALDKFSRYKVDRVRQFSEILEPQERLDPLVAFHRGEGDPRGAELARLRGMANVAELEEALEGVLRSARAAGPDDRARLFDGAMDFFPQIGAERAAGYLEEIAASLEDVGPVRRVELLDEALMLAGHLGDQDLARRVFGSLRALVSGLFADDAATLAPAMGRTLRTLRRFGMRGEASELLVALQVVATGTTPAATMARLHGAAALAYLGEIDRARPVFDEVESALAGDVPMSARLDLTRALARAVSEGPLEHALAVLDRLAARLVVVTDSFNTNSHVCVSVVAFVESIVLGYASGDLALGERARQLFDDDEYLIRRRVHRDMSHP